MPDPYSPIYINQFGGIVSNNNILVVQGRYLGEYYKFRLVIKYKNKILFVNAVKTTNSTIINGNPNYYMKLNYNIIYRYNFYINSTPVGLYANCNFNSLIRFDRGKSFS